MYESCMLIRKHHHKTVADNEWRLLKKKNESFLLTLFLHYEKHCRDEIKIVIF